MIRVRDILLALVLAAAPVAGAASDAFAAPQLDGSRRDRARAATEDGRRLELGEIVRRVQAGRDGRMLGVRPQGNNYVVRWEYPGGRIVDITVDGQTGRVIGER